MTIRKLIILLAPPILLFILFAGLRWYNLQERIIFDWDQEQFTNQIYDLVVNHKPTLLGPRVVSDKGFFLAPYFTYLLVPFYLISKLHPYALYYFILTFTAIFFFSAYTIVSRLFSRHTAFLFLLFWSINPILVGYDTIPWWPVTIPLGVLLTWFSLKNIYDRNRYRDWIFLGGVSALFVNMHFQFVFIIVFSVLFLLLFLFKNKVGSGKILSAAGSFALLFAPLLIFDIRHDFLNTKLFLGFFSQGLDTMPPDPNVWRTVFTNFLQPLLLIQNEYLMLAFYIFMVGVLILLTRTKKKFSHIFYTASLALWLIFPIVFIVYGKRPSEYYFTFLYPFIYIAIIDLFVSFRKYLVLYALVPLLIWGNLTAMQNTLIPNIFGLKQKDLAIQKLKQVTEGKKFNVSFKVPIGGHTGYDYLINYYGIKQSGNWEDDPLVQIHVPADENDIQIGAIGIILPENF